MTELGPPPAAGAMGGARSRAALATLAVGLVFVGLVLAHAPYINGPWYWQWTSRDLGLLRVMLFLAPPLLLLERARDRIEGGVGGHHRPWAILLLLALANLSLQVLGILADPRGPRLIYDIVLSPSATSYYGDALRVQDVAAWLRAFPLPTLGLHSLTHPPGPILFYVFWIWIAGPVGGAYGGALAIAVLCSLAVPAMYVFARAWGLDVGTRLLIALMYALMPALTLFFPEFDQIFPLLSMGLTATWIKALEGNVRSAALTGVLLALASFFAYHLLAFGAFLVLYALLRGRDGRTLGHALWRVASCSALVFITMGLLYAALHGATGFAPLQAFRKALEIQQTVLAPGLARPYVPALVFDLYDFLLGAGILALPMLVAHVGQWRKGVGSVRGRLLTAVGLGTILIVDVSGLLRTETARVWIFLLPLVAVPVGQQLAQWSRSERLSVIVLQWLILCVLKARMTFLEP